MTRWIDPADPGPENQAPFISLEFVGTHVHDASAYADLAVFINGRQEGCEIVADVDARGTQKISRIVLETRPYNPMSAMRCFLSVYFFGYPTDWENMILCCGFNCISFASGSLSIFARTTVASPSDAQ